MSPDRNKLASESLVQRLLTAKVGVVVRDLAGIDVFKVAAFVQKQLERELYVAVVGYEPKSKKLLPGVILEYEVEKAVEWRNTPKLAGSIVVFVHGEAPKLHSLRGFDLLTSRDLAESLLARDSQMGQNIPQRMFWAALRDEAATFPLDMLEEFVESVETTLPSDLDAIPRNMWRLGLLPDDEILTGKSAADRLWHNRALLEEMARLSENSRRRMSSALAKSKGKHQETLRDAYLSLMDFYRRGDREVLRTLKFSIVEELIRSSRPNKDLPSDIDAQSPKKGQYTQERVLKGRKLHEEVAKYVVSNDPEDEKELRELGKMVREFVQNPQQPPEDISIADQPAQLDKPFIELFKLMGMACRNNCWGGTLDATRNDLKEAIRYFTPDRFIAYNPEDPAQGVEGQTLFSLLRHFDGYLKNNTFDKALARLNQARNVLVDQLDMLLFYPLILLGGNPDIRQKMDEYIDAYSDLLRYYRINEGTLHGFDADAVRYVADRLLRLDVVYIHTPTEWKAVLTPLHPLNLWRYREILRSVHADGKPLSEQEREQLSRALPDLPQLLHYVVFTPEGEAEPEILPQAGSLEILPAYENRTNRYLGLDGIFYLKELLGRWLIDSRYSRNQIRLALVDVPDLSAAIRVAAEFMENNSDSSILIDAYFTRMINPSTRLAQLDYGGRDHRLAELMKTGKIVVHLNNCGSAQKVVDKMKERPVHIAYVFDQSLYEIGYSPRARNLVVSPLVITYEYEYSETIRRGRIVPSSEAEEGLFSDYHFLVERAAHLPAGQQIRLKYGDDRTVYPINTLLSIGATKWLVLADRTLSSYRPEEAVPLGELREGQREIAVWASASSRSVERFLTLLNKFNLRPDAKTVQELLRQFGHIATGGLLGLPIDGSLASRDKREKGLLGTVLASAWYVSRYPNALVASLDSSLARQWLQNRSETDDRADLIGLRVENDQLIVDIIEVKTRDQDAEAKSELTSENQRRLAGHAIEQLEATLEVLQPIFGGEDRQPLFTRARREVLKYQLHRECFREMRNPAWQRDWYHRLKDVFTSKSSPLTVKFNGIVLHVHLAGNESEQTTYDQTRPMMLVKLGTKAIQKLIAPPVSDDVEQTEATTNGNIKTGVDEGAEEQPSATPKSSLETITVLEVPQSLPLPTMIAPELTAPEESAEELARLFRRACQSYRIQIDECEPSRAMSGPTVWRFYVRLTRGQKLSPLRGVLEDIGREMRRSGLLVTELPNTEEVALDVPRLKRQTVPLLEVLEKLPAVSSPEQLPFPVGITPEGVHVIEDLNKVHHLLIGGTTGSGKTIFLYGLMAAMLKTHPDPNSLRLLISTSAFNDLFYFNDLPHLETGKVITDAAEATQVLQTLVSQVSEERSILLQSAHCRDIEQYNSRNTPPLPPFVVVVDEFADLADQFSGDRAKRDAFYRTVRRIAQVGRKGGVHLVLCTQRPSANLVPTDTRSLMNARVALHVNDAESSRMILEVAGAEQLQLKGDLLFKEGATLTRAQGYYVTGDELDGLLMPLKK